MNSLLIVFWAILIFASIGWYGFLVFYVGWKAGREIKVMTKTLGEAAEAFDRAGG